MFLTQKKESMYDHNKVEEKWQQVWENNQLFQQSEGGGFDAKVGSGNRKDNISLLFAFAYPSGSGLHVGHVESKTALDILARYYRMKGKNVFFPVGWDAFGLPAENYAIKTGVHPAETTVSAIDTFRRQIKRLGISYDWANEIATSHPEYYRWTQWIFLQLYSKGLAYQKDGKVNWCPSCQTVLANEQVVEGLCERCDSEVEQKDMKQWYYQITKYQEELISGLDDVDWPSATKAQQLNWIGKSEGANVTFDVVENDTSLVVYTTAHDTIYGCTFMVVAPEHIFLEENKKNIINWSEIEEYIQAASKKTELERQAQKKKTGALVKGITLVNPVNGVEVPLYVADYVLAGYGTGAIMAVPGHDERDFEFAQKYSISVIQTARSNNNTKNDEFISYSDIKQDKDKFIQINSEEFNDLTVDEARKGILKKLIKEKKGVAKTQYRLRDWLISRQRYWGTPIPIVYDPDGNAHPVAQSNLPWKLPTDVDFKPTGESPLKSSEEFAKRTQKYAAEVHADLIKEKGWDLSGKGWRPEYDTMDTFVDSSWYFFRYTDSRNPDVFAKTEQMEKWLPADLYMIGPEHIVLHLLYSRFFTKFLRDEGHFKFGEPFAKMRHQGMILGPDNKKMSKSKGNVISPDEIIEKFGADTLRVYEMFMGPLEADKPWDIRAVIGIYKFLQKIDRLVSDTEQAGVKIDTVSGDSKVILQRKLHQAIKKVSEDIPKLKFNTAIAFMMEFINLWQELVNKEKMTLSIEDKISFVQILAPFAPFLTDELFDVLSKQASGADSNEQSKDQDYKGVHVSNWPKFNETLAKDSSIKIPVQINGKVRAQLEVSADQVDNEQIILEKAVSLEALEKYLDGNEIKKKIYIKGKIVSLVV
jgi:leucyl-tRNA synthetase